MADELEMSSDEEDEILGNMRRGQGTVSTDDPYGGPKTTGASSSLDFAAMRDAFQDAGLDLDSAPVRKFNDQIRPLRSLPTRATTPTRAGRATTRAT